MPRLVELLDKLRPAIAPGADSPSGVPADHRREVEAELAPLLAVVADYQLEADRARTAATERARRVLGDAGRRADLIVEHARRQAETVRAESMSAVREEAEAELTAIGADADRRTDLMRRGAEQLLPGVVEHVVAESMSLVGL
jgi:vacuolar-type H+-ATPase subunit H